jgi:hypothetical protein
MQSFDKKRSYTFRADANALGGFLVEPFDKNIPALAPVSLPAAGGYATARSGAFNLDEIVSCSSAYTRVSGRVHADGSVSVLSAAVAEDFNILDVVTAERIVAQIAVTIPSGNGPRTISFAGTGFEGLRLAGRRINPKFHAGLHQPAGDSSVQPLPWQKMQDAGKKQLDALIECFKKQSGAAAGEWAAHRQGATQDGRVLSSLVEGFDDPEALSSWRHIVDIPAFGRIYLGELLISADAVQLVSIRAELGCTVGGVVTGPSPANSGGHGSGDN